MEDTKDYIDVDEQMWEHYLQECRALEVRPSLSDYMVWKQELDLDE